MIPGEYILQTEPIQCNVGRATVDVHVVNTGDRPVQVGSHFHFFEANKQLAFNRAITVGFRLNIAAGTAVRFEPGEEKTVTLVTFGGNRIIHGFNNLTNGLSTDAAIQATSIEKATLHQFKNQLP